MTTSASALNFAGERIAHKTYTALKAERGEQ